MACKLCYKYPNGSGQKKKRFSTLVGLMRVTGRLEDVDMEIPDGF